MLRIFITNSLFILLTLISLVILAPITAHPAWQPEVRVMILNEVRDFSASGKNLEWIPLSRDKPIHPIHGKVIIRSSNGNIIIGKEDTGMRALSLKADDEVIEINGIEFRGHMSVYYNTNGTLKLINHVGLEDYLTGIINLEISSGWHIEAVKAQAVVSRSYALYRKYHPKDPRYDMESTTLDQVYKGRHTEDKRARGAIINTWGIVIQHNKEVAETVYHSCCGGHTASGEEVWGNGKPYWKGVPCPYDDGCTYWKWVLRLTWSEMEEILADKGLIQSPLKDITISGRDKSGRVSLIQIKTDDKILKIKSKEFRELLGFERLRSTKFKLFFIGKNNIQFVGKGSGHGVGMCQWGAKGMAEKGSSYEEIIKYYYHDVTLKKLY